MERQVRARNTCSRRQSQQEHDDTKEESSGGDRSCDSEQSDSSVDTSSFSPLDNAKGENDSQADDYNTSEPTDHDSIPGFTDFSPLEQAQAPALGPDLTAVDPVPGRKPTSARQKQQTTQATISDDRSRGSEFERTGRLFVAFKRGNRKLQQPGVVKSQSPIPEAVKYQGVALDGPNSGTPTEILIEELEPASGPSFDFAVGRKKASEAELRAYQNKLILLEQQKTKRLMMARQETGLQSTEKPDRSFSGVPFDTAFFDPQALGIPETSLLSIEALRAYIYNLQLKASQFDDNATLQKPNKFLVIHRIMNDKNKKSFFDRPRWVVNETSAAPVLESDRTISNLSLHLARNPEIIFLVYRDYAPSALAAVRPKAHEVNSLSTVDHTSETVEPLTESLKEAMAAFFEEQDRQQENNGGAGLFKTFTAPYLPVYHSRDTLSEFSAGLEDEESFQFDILTRYIFEQYGDEYGTVDSLIKRGKITNRYLQYLIKPGDVLVEGKHQFASGYICKSWLQEKSLSKPSRAGTRKFTIAAWSWIFQGFFSQKATDLLLSVDGDDDSEKLIDELNVRPLSHVDKLTREKMRLRGETFWKCRVRRFVSYHEDKSRAFHHSGDDRYMIDLKMYRELHKKDKDRDNTYLGAKDDLEDGVLEKDEPPNEQFLYMLPSTIKGYNLKKKKWLDLEVYQIGDVVWNTEAFEGLVLDKKTKRLIQALVSNQIEAEKGTDLISGKGNGLILLLHGGPGTGKTLTAESVAEIAKKPLYPVTCGDIGTEPEDVENYLESVLHLGKTWECVVLLDEADVFLEQRSLEDLRRNALVSVFLRALEYYDGILILTSNRVGTFDEAFKSRIQLALHYANLSQFSRTKIWGNFIQRLEKMNEQGIDFDDLNDHIERLAEYRMNGREIRNVITTARISARWEGETLNFKFLESIIKTTGRFNLYLEKLNNGYSQDKLAEDEGLRLAGAVEDGPAM